MLGCGASIAKHVDRGDTVWTLILGQGIASRKQLTKQEKEEAVAGLQADAKRANNILGIKKLLLKNLPDNRFDSIPLLTLVHTIEDIIERLRPHIIYTHHEADVNIDHRLTYQAVQAATRPLYESVIEQIFSFEIASSTEWNFTQKRFAPNVFNEINDDTLKRKINALKAYKSEIQPFPHPRSPEYLEALATVRGGQSGFMLAEAFELVYWRRQ